LHQKALREKQLFKDECEYIDFETYVQVFAKTSICLEHANNFNHTGLFHDFVDCPNPLAFVAFTIRDDIAENELFIVSVS